MGQEFGGLTCLCEGKTSQFAFLFVQNVSIFSSSSLESRVNATVLVPFVLQKILVCACVRACVRKCLSEKVCEGERRSKVSSAIDLELLEYGRTFHFQDPSNIHLFITDKKQQLIVEYIHSLFFVVGFCIMA